jgi:hypothetical protein
MSVGKTFRVKLNASPLLRHSTVVYSDVGRRQGVGKPLLITALSELVMSHNITFECVISDFCTVVDVNKPEIVNATKHQSWLLPVAGGHHKKSCVEFQGPHCRSARK